MVCKSTHHERAMHRASSTNLIEKPAVTKDGKLFYIQPLKVQVEPLLEELFKSLSPRSIFFRFLRYWKSVPPEIGAYLAKIDCELNVAMVALRKSESEDLILGLCSILRKPGANRGELAIVVRDDWQGLGVGGALAAQSLHAAKSIGIKELRGIILPENTAMIAMSRKLGFKVYKDWDSDLYEMDMVF